MKTCTKKSMKLWTVNAESSQQSDDIDSDTGDAETEISANAVPDDTDSDTGDAETEISANAVPDDIDSDTGDANLNSFGSV